MPDRVASALATTQALRSWMVQRLAVLASQVRVQVLARAQEAGLVERLEQLAPEAQRFGTQMWKRVEQRWPALAELVSERVGPVVAARVKRPAARAYRPSPVAATPAPTPASTITPPPTAANIDELITALANAPTWEERNSAAQDLRGVVDEHVTTALVNALRDASAEVAISAIDALGLRADARSQSALRDVLQNVEGFWSPVVRVAALQALAPKLATDGLEILFGALRDVDAELSIAAVATIAMYAPPTLATQQLLPVLFDTTGFFLPVVRAATANALERSGLLDAATAGRLLPDEHDSMVRAVLDRVANAS